MSRNKSGFSVVELVIILVVVGVIGAVGYMVMGKKGDNKSSSGSSTGGWALTQSGWESTGTPPACSDPMSIPSPTDTSKVVSMLYPGQYRGGNYKPHGGFRFTDGTNDNITVTLPLDAKLYKGSRYTEQGETQYLLAFINPCGIMFKFDHLDTLTADFQKVVDDNFPPAKDNNSQTTNLSKDYSYKAGTVIATGVGFKKTKNSVFDFGVYDLRKKNAISANAEWAAAHKDDVEYAPYAVCWLDLLPSADSTRIKNLPAADSVSGAISDYCKTTSGNTLTNTVGNPGTSGASSSAAASSSAGGGDGSGASSSGSGSGNGTGGGSGNR